MALKDQRTRVEIGSPGVPTPGTKRRGLVARFALAGATLGMLVGFYEAALLYFVPRIPGHLQTDVRYVIWFLAPLGTLVFFGLLGSILGWAATWTRLPSPLAPAILAAVGMGLVGAYAACSHVLLHVWITDLLTAGDLVTATLWFALLFVGTLFALRLGWDRVGRFFGGEAHSDIRIWTKAVILATVVLVSGVVFYAAGGFVVRFSTQASELRAAGRPNIILITLDTTRADHLSIYGYARPTTPHIDSLARQGLVFEDTLSSTSWTLPAHASIFTGLLPHQHGAGWAVPLDTSALTLAEILNSRGYQTAGFTANFGYGPAGWGMGQGFSVYDDDSFSVRHNFIQTLLGGLIVQPLYQNLVAYDRFDRRSAQQINRDVFRWFERRSTVPFFVFINYYDAHAPYLAPPPYDRRFGQISENLKRNPISAMGERVPKTLSRDEEASLIAGYDNCLAYLDEQVGKLLEFLSSTPDWSKTIVIITSDHGEGFGEHNAYGHGWNLYRETLQVPLIFYGPGIPRGRRIRQIARIREIFTTVLDLTLGDSVPLRRSSMRRFWAPDFKPEPVDDVAVSELTPDYREPDRPILISLMTSEWHFIHDSRGNAELYHRPTDPLENENLSRSPRYQPTAQALEERLEEYVRRSRRPWSWSEYLLALDRPGHPFLREAVSSPTWMPRRPASLDEELVKSLPYH